METGLAPERMHVVAWCFFAYGSLLLGSAWSINCTASPYSLVPEQTQYNISDDSRIPDVNGSDCWLSWAQDKRVLANHHDEPDPVVVSYSINHLITSRCFDNMTFTMSCFSEGIGHEVLCKPNCTLINALLRSQKPKEIDAATDATVGAAVGVILVLLAVLLGVCLWCKLKVFSSWRPPTWIYAAVNMQNGDPRPADAGIV